MDIDGLFMLFVQPELFDTNARPKTIRALQNLCDRVPDDVFLTMPTLSILAPDAKVDGAVYRPVPEIVIYFAPILENEPQNKVDFTVAHEFAHVFLRHHEENDTMITWIPYLEQPPEVASDELVKQ
jgi:hypothetical protein